METTGAQTTEKPRHFSLIRELVAADFLTLGNAACGAGIILALLQYVATREPGYLTLGFALFPIALALDIADGRVARWRHHQSTLGKDLDSLADIVSFGVAPAALGFTLGLRGALDVAILLYFVACGISRLARFNVTASALSDESGKVRYFEGTPIPTSLLLVLVLFVLTRMGRTGDALPFGVWDLGVASLHPLAILYFVSGSAMISKTLHIPKL